MNVKILRIFRFVGFVNKNKFCNKHHPFSLFITRKNLQKIGINPVNDHSNSENVSELFFLRKIIAEINEKPNYSLELSCKNQSSFQPNLNNNDDFHIFLASVIVLYSKNRKNIQELQKKQNIRENLFQNLRKKLQEDNLNLQEFNTYLSLIFAKEVFTNSNLINFDEQAKVWLKDFVDIFDSSNQEKPLHLNIILKIVLFYRLFHKTNSHESFKNIKKAFLHLKIFPFLNEILIKYLQMHNDSNIFSQNVSLFLQSFFFLLENTVHFPELMSSIGDLTSNSNLSLELSLQILEYFRNAFLSHQKQKGSFHVRHQEIINNNLEILLNSLETIKQNLDKVDHEILINLLLIISKENLIRYYHDFITELWQSVILNLEKKYKLLRTPQKINFFYSLGKSGFITRNLEGKYREELQRFEIYSTSWRFYLKFLKSGQNFSLIKKNSPLKSLEKLIGMLPSFEKNECKEILVSYAPVLLRLSYSNKDFWRLYFEQAEEFIDDPQIQKFSIYFVLKVFPLIFSEKNLELSMCKEEMKNLQEFYLKAVSKPKISKFVNMSLGKHFKEIPIERKQTSSTLEDKIGVALEKMGMKYIEQATSKKLRKKLMFI